jgi:hypothetical protein
MQGTHAAQMVGSLLVALAIVAVAIAVVTAYFGPTSAAEREVQDERIEQREELLEERREAREETPRRTSRAAIVVNGLARHRYIRPASLFHFFTGNEPCLKASSKS